MRLTAIATLASLDGNDFSVAHFVNQASPEARIENIPWHYYDIDSNSQV
jgi:hypothetical protein